MKFPLYIAKRYLFTKSENNAINIISRIASLGVIVGSGYCGSIKKSIFTVMNYLFLNV